MELADLADVPEVEMPRGMPGFPEAHRFVLVPLGEGADSDLGDRTEPPSPYSLLRSLDVEGLAFVVVPSAVFFPEYAPVITDDVAAELELGSADDAIVLLVVTVGDPVETSTVNLMGPVIVNRHTRRGAQAVLSPDDHSTRHPLLAATS